MVALTVRLPDEKRRRFNALTKSLSAPPSCLIDERRTLWSAECDAKMRFRLPAHRVSLLDKVRG